MNIKRFEKNFDHYDIIVKNIPIPDYCKSKEHLVSILIEQVVQILRDDKMLLTLTGDLQLCEIQKNYKAFQPYCHAFLCFENVNKHHQIAMLLNGKIIVNNKRLTTELSQKPALHLRILKNIYDPFILNNNFNKTENQLQKKIDVESLQYVFN